MSNQGQRSFRSALAPENLQSIQRGTHNFMEGLQRCGRTLDFCPLLDAGLACQAAHHHRNRLKVRGQRTVVCRQRTSAGAHILNGETMLRERGLVADLERMT